MSNTGSWPSRRLALWGDEGCGKTHLLHIWAARHGARVVAGPGLELQPPTVPLAIDDADAAPELPLLHALNAAAEAGLAVLLASRTPPARWRTSLPDLSSRLRAITAVSVSPADDELLRTLLARLLAERQLIVPEALQEWLLVHLPRSQGTIR